MNLLEVLLVVLVAVCVLVCVYVNIAWMYVRSRFYDKVFKCTQEQSNEFLKLFKALEETLEAIYEDMPKE